MKCDLCKRRFRNNELIGFRNQSYCNLCYVRDMGGRPFGPVAIRVKAGLITEAEAEALKREKGLF